MFSRVGIQAAETLRIPLDVIPGEPVVTVTGRQRVYIENYHKIIAFHEEEIRLQARTCRVIIKGRRLQIVYYTKEDMLIAGQICSVCMET